jgi:ABC-type uncharacterized transport system permease subunit
MKYQHLKSKTIHLEKEMFVTASQNGTILIPEKNTKTFLHWLNENGKMTATYTLTSPTLVKDTVKLINGSGKTISIDLIDL